MLFFLSVSSLSFLSPPPLKFFFSFLSPPPSLPPASECFPFCPSFAFSAPSFPWTFPAFIVSLPAFCSSFLPSFVEPSCFSLFSKVLSLFTFFGPGKRLGRSPSDLSGERCGSVSAPFDLEGVPLALVLSSLLGSCVS